MILFVYWIIYFFTFSKKKKLFYYLSEGLIIELNLYIYIILYIIKVGLRRRSCATWLHQIAEILLNFYIFKELKRNSILLGL